MSRPRKLLKPDASRPRSRSTGRLLDRFADLLAPERGFAIALALLCIATILATMARKLPSP